MKKLVDAFRNGLTPDPDLNYYDWAEKYFILPPGSATPGLINMEMTPYLIEPLVNLSWSSPVKEEYWMKGIQLGVSTLFDIVVCGLVDYFPSPLIMYFGSDSMAIEYVKTRLEPSFENNLKLRGKISDGYDRKGKSTHSLKLFPGGSLKFIGGVSEKSYRSYSAAVVLMDDIDAFPRDVDGTEKRKGQGSPIDLARTRTNARQGKYKMGVSGSPTDKETSLIYENFIKYDRRFYHVPCPYCGHLQTIDFLRIKFKKNSNGALLNAPALECENCNILIPEKEKFNMMQPSSGAKWISTNEVTEPLRVSRHLSSAYSLIGYNWTAMAKEFIVATEESNSGKTAKLRTFYNTKLGLPWEDARKKKHTLKHSALYDSRENWKAVPEDGIIITAGVDIQGNRIEILVAAHGPKTDVYCLEYKVIGGDTLIEYGLEGSPFNGLEAYLDQTFKNEWKKNQPILHTCIDMGFNSITVSHFLRKMQSEGMSITGVFGGSSKTKNKDFVGAPVTNKYEMTQRELNVDEGKTLNFNKLKTGLIHFNKHPSFTENFFRQLTVEQWDAEKGYWICPDHARNEATDMLNYLTAALFVYSDGGNLDWESFKHWNRAGCVLESGSDIEVINEGEIF